LAVLLKGKKRMRMAMTMQARVPWGIHGLTKELFGPAMPSILHPTGGRFKGDRPQGGQPVAVLLKDTERMRITMTIQARISSGIHRLIKVLLRPAMTYVLRPVGCHL
jgi:hypothetical protein